MALLKTNHCAIFDHVFPGWRGLWFALLAFVLSSGARAANPPVANSREYQIKAVFLFNFAQFVDWPPEAFSRSDDPMVIGVLGEDPFGAVLDETVRGEKLGQRALVVRRYRRIEDISDCHILFISRSEAAHLEHILEVLGNRSILTVGDTAGYALKGVMIRFINEAGKIRLRINLDAAKAAHLTISSKLLRPAEIVTKQ